MSLDFTKSAGFYQFLAWLEINKKKATAGAVLLAAAIIAVSFGIWMKGQREKTANAALFKLGLPIEQSRAGSAPTAADYVEIARQYPKTRAGERALLLGAGMLFSESKYSESLTEFRNFLAKYKDSALRAGATFGVAANLDSLNKIDEAIEAYQAVIRSYPSTPESTQAKLAMGLLHEAKNQPEKALKVYDEVSRQGSSQLWESTAKDRREQLLLKHPELAQINKASALAPAVVAPATNPAASIVQTSAPAMITPSVTNPPVATQTNAAPPKPEP